MEALGLAMAVAGGGVFLYKGAEKNKILKSKKSAEKNSIPGYFKPADLEITDPSHITWDANQKATAYKSGIYGLPKVVVKGTDQHGHTNVWGTKDTNSYWARKEA